MRDLCSSVRFLRENSWRLTLRLEMRLILSYQLEVRLFSFYVSNRLREYLGIMNVWVLIREAVLWNDKFLVKIMHCLFWGVAGEGRSRKGSWRIQETHEPVYQKHQNIWDKTFLLTLRAQSAFASRVVERCHFKFTHMILKIMPFFIQL